LDGRRLKPTPLLPDHPTPRERFAHQARQQSDGIALLHGETRISYGALARRSAEIAARLRERGVHPGERVAMALPRSPAAVAGLLGVLEAGAVAMPLDPELPPARLAHLLERGRAPWLIAERDHQPARFGGETVHLEMLEGLPAELPRPGVLDPRLEAALPYLIFTSGSTGEPKGVLGSWPGVASYLDHLTATYSLGAGDTVLHAVSPAFDPALREIFGALATGARLLIPTAAEFSSPALLVNAARRHGVTCMLSLVPTLLRLLAEEGQPGALESVRLVLTCSEPLYAADCRALHRLCGESVRLVNQYGVSESSMAATRYPVDRVPDAGLISIGEALPGKRVDLLDRTGGAVAAGEQGEIWLAGDGLASGYDGAAAATAACFRPDPLATVPGARRYRTGDLATHGDGGMLQLTGRADDQLTWRGHRIEPAEVEACLAGHPEVIQAALALRADPAGRQRLVAFVAARSPDLSALRRWAAEHLPPAWVPSTFVPLAELPRTAQGKLDRRRLPELAETVPAAADPVSAGSPAAAPVTATERAVCAMFEELLGNGPLPADADFLTLGGDSLAAMRLRARIGRRFGIELSAARLFAGPTARQVAHWIDHTSEASDPELAALPRVGEQEGLRLSSGQRGLWLLERSGGNPGAYNLPLLLELDGPVQAPRLARALTAVAARHEVLRTVIDEAGGVPRPRLLAAAAVALPVIDLRRLAPIAARRRARLLTRSMTARPFDLGSERPLRAALLITEPKRARLLAVFHHIAFDGASVAIFLDELAAAREGVEPPVLTARYRDWVEWQRRWVGGPAAASQLAHWRQRIDPEAFCELPSDGLAAPAAARAGRAGRANLRLSEATTRALEQLARRRGATLFATLLTLYAVLLHRWSGRDRIAIGAPVSNRGAREAERLLGYFANLLVLDHDLAHDPDLGALIDRAQAGVVAALDHGRIPFDRVVEAVRPPRRPGRHPLVQTALVLEDPPWRRRLSGGLEARQIKGHEVAIPFELELHLWRDGSQLEGYLSYDRRRFARATARRLAGQLEVLLSAAGEAEDEPISRLPLLTESERTALLAAWGACYDDLPGPWPVHRQVERQARSHPDAVALVASGRQVTYGEWVRRARQLAGTLRRLGVGTEVPVALYLAPEPELFVAVLAILIAGGAYLPLDVEHPAERIAYLLADSGVEWVLSRAELAARLPAGGQRWLDLDDESLFEGPAAASQPTFPAATAYILYTSGSTGQPKGVRVSHENLRRLFGATREPFHFGPRDVWTCFHSIAFDFSVWESWGALVQGGRLVIVPRTVARAPRAFLQLLASERVTVLNQTPAAFQALVEEDARCEAGEGLVLRWVLFGGDRLDFATLAPWWHRHGDRAPRLANLYGITETTVHVTCRPLRRRDLLLPADSSRIGRPLSDLALRVLDRRGQLAAPGVPGEIHVGGAGVAPGYHRRPRLTAERFVPDPAASVPGARLYRSGDLGRLLPGGDLEYLGRIDDQVKIRGFRVEPGEIEAVLRGHPQVREAAVAVRQPPLTGDSFGLHLVAFVVPRGATPERAELRRHLAQRLPSHMVPDAWVELAELPLTANGKVDRARLPLTDSDIELPSDTPFAPPRSPIEQGVIEIFSSLLGTAHLGVHDDFFELGGHSLLVTQLASRLRSLLGAEVSLAELFDAPTPAAIAERIQRQIEGQAALEPAPAPRAQRAARLPASFAQERLWFLDQTGITGNAYHSRFNFRLRGALDRPALWRALREVVRRHETLRTALRAGPAGLEQTVLPPGSPEPALTDLSALPAAAQDRQVEAWLAGEYRRPFDLAAGRPLRSRLLHLAPGDHLLVTSFHHIAYDGWSSQLFADELSALYRCFAAGRPSPLPELALQYADFALWQREMMRGARLETLLAHWRQRLALELPRAQLADRSRPAVETFRGGIVSVALGAPVRRQLEQLSARQGTTLYMTLLAGFLTVLHRTTGETLLTIGSPIANRTRGEIEGLIGFFVNSLTLRCDLTGDPSFATLLERVRQIAINAYTHQDLPFERLVEELRPDRSLSRNPLFQVIFALQQPPASLSLDGTGVTATPVEETESRVRFDLEVHLWPTNDGLEARWIFNRDLFDPTTVRRLALHLRRLLGAACEDPASRLSGLPVLAASERHQLLVEWNDRQRPLPQTAIPQLFEIQARRRPTAIAVVDGDRRMSYGELWHRSAALARRLRRHGVGRAVVVAVVAERSLETVIALLAVCTAGGCYLPIDPTTPEQRLQEMLALCDTQLVLAAPGSMTASVRCAVLPITAEEFTPEELQQAEPSWAHGADAGDPA
jgi:amino acid adenylation domain-containing protein